MTDYQHHPDYSYGIEIRDGWNVDDYVAQARGFRTTAEFREYMNADEERKADMRRNRENPRSEKRDESTNDEDLMRFVRLAGLI